MNTNKTYKRDDYEILWQPEICVHSTICWKGMQEVFNPFRRPWIVLENGEREAIKKQVMACPSGALKWVEKLNESSNNESSRPQEIVQIMLAQNGPLIIQGDVMIIHPDGKRELKENQSALCRCGASSKKPFCDGSHKQTGFES